VLVQHNNALSRVTTPEPIDGGWRKVAAAERESGGRDDGIHLGDRLHHQVALVTATTTNQTRGSRGSVDGGFARSNKGSRPGEALFFPQEQETEKEKKCAQWPTVMVTEVTVPTFFMPNTPVSRGLVCAGRRHV
jgi:hypothetical protein